MTDELLDLVDKNDEVIGTVWKSEAHKDPKKIHREIAVALFDRKGRVLLQRRSLNKANDPGAWKVTAAGHVGKGEDPKKAAERELYEELRIKASLKYFNKRFAKYKDKESRFFWTYFSIIDNSELFKLDKDEVMDAKWVPVVDLEKFAKENDYSLESTSHKLITELARKLKIV